MSSARPVQFSHVVLYAALVHLVLHDNSCIFNNFDYKFYVCSGGSKSVELGGRKIHAKIMHFLCKISSK